MWERGRSRRREPWVLCRRVGRSFADSGFSSRGKPKYNQHSAGQVQFVQSASPPRRRLSLSPRSLTRHGAIASRSSFARWPTPATSRVAVVVAFVGKRKHRGGSERECRKSARKSFVRESPAARVVAGHRAQGILVWRTQSGTPVWTMGFEPGKCRRPPLRLAWIEL